jgi:hypothetical protein
MATEYTNEQPQEVSNVEETPVEQTTETQTISQEEAKNNISSILNKITILNKPSEQKAEETTPVNTVAEPAQTSEPVAQTTTITTPEQPAQAEVKVTAEIEKNITEEDVKKLTEVTEIDEESFNKKITESLCAVYENVESFTLTGCSLDDNKLILEGLVAFKSTKTRPTTYVFEAQELDKTINLVGTNSELFESCEINLTTTVIKESLYANELTYKYSVQGNLLEGLIRN